MKTTYIIILGIIVLVLCGLVWVVLYSPLVALRFEAVDNEVFRLKSPDCKVDAVYIQSNAGAMTSVQHSIYVVPEGQKPKKNDTAVFFGNRVWDLKITWESNCKLLIRSGSGTIDHFQNDIYPFPKDREYKVEIVLDRSTKESS